MQRAPRDVLPSQPKKERVSNPNPYPYQEEEEEEDISDEIVRNRLTHLWIKHDLLLAASSSLPVKWRAHCTQCIDGVFRPSPHFGSHMGKVMRCYGCRNTTPLS